MEHGNIVITHLCTLRTPWSVPVYESHTSEKTRPDGVCWLGGGRLISLHSDKLCSVDMPPALNKPVAAPRVESIASTVLDRRRIKCMKKCITRAFLMFLLHSVSWHIFCPTCWYTVHLIVRSGAASFFSATVHLHCCRKTISLWSVMYPN